ncbi:hypothetical protein [Roseobacter sp. HKCCA0434]|uniref:hypothetical protein n=1 Tax=Roseobacter sp. HKCCA0434 TaxID=3079297 RepID=UPI002905E1CB|nr:hypothetical protein [Roseobacter sp. HKCCA0434]
MKTRAAGLLHNPLAALVIAAVFFFLSQGGSEWISSKFRSKPTVTWFVEGNITTEIPFYAGHAILEEDDFDSDLEDPMSPDVFVLIYDEAHGDELVEFAESLGAPSSWAENLQYVAQAELTSSGSGKRTLRIVIINPANFSGSRNSVEGRLSSMRARILGNS